MSVHPLGRVKRSTRLAALMEIVLGLSIGLALNSRAALVAMAVAIVLTILVPRIVVIRRYGPDPDSLVVRTPRSRPPDDPRDPDA